MVKKLGDKMNVVIRPHDLRHHSATYASRNGVPLEVISKVILRHQDLKTAQMHLGRISVAEALRWMDLLHGKVVRLCRSLMVRDRVMTGIPQERRKIGSQQ